MTAHQPGIALLVLPELTLVARLTRLQRNDFPGHSAALNGIGRSVRGYRSLMELYAKGEGVCVGLLNSELITVASLLIS